MLTLTVSGPPMSGKTRLAVQVAAFLAKEGRLVVLEDDDTRLRAKLAALPGDPPPVRYSPGRLYLGAGSGLVPDVVIRDACHDVKRPTCECGPSPKAPQPEADDETGDDAMAEALDRSAARIGNLLRALFGDVEADDPADTVTTLVGCCPP